MAISTYMKKNAQILTSGCIFGRTSTLIFSFSFLKIKHNDNTGADISKKYNNIIALNKICLTVPDVFLFGFSDTQWCRKKHVHSHPYKNYSYRFRTSADK
jgi:hypothetical protein